MPYFILLIAALVSNKLKCSTRVLPWILIGVEMVLALVSWTGILNFRPLGLYEFYSLIDYDVLCHVLTYLLFVVLILTPFSKRTVLMTYSGILTIIYAGAVVLEIIYDFTHLEYGFSFAALFWITAATVYQFSIFWFAFEMTNDNRLHVFSRIFDFFIGLDYFDDDCDEDYFDDDIYIDKTAKFDALIIDEDYDESCSEAKKSRWKHIFDDMLLKGIDVIEIAGGEFLLDPLAESKIIFELQYTDGAVTVNGKFIYSFDEDLSARILRKRSVLNKTFADIELDAVADTEIGVEYIEEGLFTIRLRKKSFDISDGNYDSVRDYMIRFMETIIIIQNTESYE